MQISTEKRSAKKSMIDVLVEIGYSKEKATNLYNKYHRWGKLETLQDFIDSKTTGYKPKQQVMDEDDY